jgi:hypothetical protein
VQGYGEVGDNGYSVANNVAAKLPINLAPGDSLVSSIFPDVPYNEKNRPALKVCSILTCVAEPPPPISFRPPYAGKVAPRYTFGQLKFDLLQNLEQADGMPSAADLLSYMVRPWLDHVPGWIGRSIHPRDHMPDYGRDLCTRMGIVALAVHCDIPSETKKALAVDLVQWGIDLRGLVDTGSGGNGHWTANGGHAQGRKWPILFAGLMLGDTAMMDLSAASFGEDEQTYIDANGQPEWMIRLGREDPSWGAAYRQCCTANSWHGMLLAAMLMGAKKRWNHPALFAYQDRYVATEKGDAWVQAWHPWPLAMWHKYRGTV